MTLTLAIDVGGTKISVGLINEAYQITRQIRFDSGRGIPRLRRTLRQVVDWVTPDLVTSIAVATPGKLIGINQMTLAPNTAQNLNAYPGEFDHFDWDTMIHDVFGNGITAFLINDALAQMAGGLMDLNLQLPLTPLLIGYLGPGTGLGGGCVEQLTDGQLRFLTDGHFFDILLPRDPEDIWSAQGEWVMAEDVISGRGFYDITGISLAECCQSAQLSARYASLITCFGRYLGQLIATIHSGKFSKKYAEYQWPIWDLNVVSRITTWVIGGSVGPLLIPAATEWLSAHQIPAHLHIIPNGAEAALRGVVYARNMT